MIVCVVTQLIYLTKFFLWETGYLCTLDIIHDRFGADSRDCAPAPAYVPLPITPSDPSPRPWPPPHFSRHSGQYHCVVESFS